MRLDLCVFEKWRQLLNKAHLSRMFCTLYFSSHMSRGRLLVPFDSHGKGRVQVRCFVMGINAAQELSDELLCY